MTGYSHFGPPEKKTEITEYKVTEDQSGSVTSVPRTEFNSHSVSVIVGMNRIAFNDYFLP